jgi:hypothetical protein
MKQKKVPEPDFPDRRSLPVQLLQFATSTKDQFKFLLEVTGHFSIFRNQWTFLLNGVLYQGKLQERNLQMISLKSLQGVQIKFHAGQLSNPKAETINIILSGDDVFLTTIL